MLFCGMSKIGYLCANVHSIYNWFTVQLVGLIQCVWQDNLVLREEKLSSSTQPYLSSKQSQISRFMGPTWGLPGSCRPQVGGPHVGTINLVIRDVKCFMYNCVLWSDTIRYSLVLLWHEQIKGDISHHNDKCRIQISYELKKTSNTSSLCMD